MHHLFKILLFIILFLNPIISMAQDADTARFSGNFQNAPLKSVFQKIESELGVSFFYEDDWISPDMQVTARFNRHQLQDIMPKLLSQTELTYVAIGNTIILIPAVEVVQVVGSSSMFGSNADDAYDVVVVGDPSQMGKYKNINIEGKIVDGANGEPLIGAIVKIEGTNKYAVSGYTGDYRLILTQGVYDAIITCMGYEDKRMKIKVISPDKLDIEMFETSHEIGEVLITSTRTENNIRGNQMSVVEMDAKSIKQLPLVTGEKDIIKSFTMMPGVKSVGEFGSGINVRGGGEDQNLYLIENVPIFNTSHALGLMSVINPDAVTGVTLYKGHIPAEYGDRVSSVMDIRMQEPALERFRLRGGIGIYSSRLQIETPLLNKKITLQVGGRTSYSDYLLKNMSDYYLSHSLLNFYDLNALVNIKFKNNPISVFGYMSNDFFRYSNIFSYKYGNKLAGLTWTHLFNADWVSNLTLTYSNYHNFNKHFDEVRNTYSTEADVRHLSAKLKINYTGFSNHNLTVGAQFSDYQLNPGVVKPYNSDAEIESVAVPFDSDDERARDIAIFANDVYDITSQLSLQVGLRCSFYNKIGASTVYQYDETRGVNQFCVVDSVVYADGESVQKYTAFEPRLSLKYMINNLSSVKLSYNRNMQNISLLSNSSISTPEDIWKLADTYVKPMKVNQIALGYYRNFYGDMFETSVEVYYKTLRHSYEFREGVTVAPSNHYESMLIDVDGENYGIEFLFKKTMGQLTGSLSYTYSRSFHKSHGQFDEEKINNNKKFASSFDKPHDLSIALSYAYNRRIRFGANWAFSSGRPYTSPEYIYQFQNQQVVQYSERNKYRIEPYHRLDLSLSIDENLRKKRSWKGSWTFSVLNVYARKNAYSITYKRDVPSADNDYNMFSLYKIYLIGVPFPTITYNFTF